MALRPTTRVALATAALALSVIGISFIASPAFAVTSATTRFIAEFEGICKTPCNDPAGYATIGHGHLIAYRPVNGSDWKKIWVPGQKRRGRLTEGEAKRLLRRDLASYEAEVLARLPGVQLTPPMITALVSFAFNLGPGYLDFRKSNGFTRSTNVAGKLKRGRYYRAARDMRIYDGVIQGGRRYELPGLTRRRNDEYKLMVKGIRQLGNCDTRCTAPDPGNSGGIPSN